jgi:hypothetical protein
VYRFLEGVVIRRLTKTSFRIGITESLDLSVAYNLCILSCIYYLFCHSIISNVNNPGVYNLTILDFPTFNLNEESSASMIIAISALLLIGRIITKAKGCLYGRLHFSAIFIATSIYIALEIFIELTKTHSIDILYNDLYLRINSFIDFYNIFGYLPVICSLSLVTFFELVLSITSPTSKSILIVSDKFPSDFRVITGLNQFMVRLKDKMISQEAHLKNRLRNQRNYDEIKHYCMENIVEKDNDPDFQKNIFIKLLNYYNKLNNDDGVNIKLYSMLYPKRYSLKRIICVTRSLVMIDVITNILADNLQLRKVDVRVVIAPPSKAIQDFEQGMKETPWSLGNFIRYKNWEIQKYKERYCKRYRNLRRLQVDKILSVVEHYLGNTVFVIVEYGDDEKELLFSIRDSGSMKKRIGLFTQEPHVISHFEGIFENIWKNKS